MMKTYMKNMEKILAVLILLVMVGTLFIQVPKVCAIEANNQDKALTFLSDVVKLNMSLYTVKLGSQFVDFPPHWNGIAEEVIQYDLDWKNESILYVTCRFRDNQLYGCSIIASRGSPIYVEPQITNAVDSAKGILDRYMTYFQATYIKELQNVLNTVDTTNTVTTLGNVKLVTSSTIETESKAVIDKFEWIYTVNGVDAPQNTFRVS
ncbi:MAG: hypothetical protein FWB84_01970 [Candidatus Bathyarchaeota archaeon]|uniref:hypothetical protein n=2 Tax=Candidatus Bathycorpusculum sp. TaxID=2994959 RepID=UPI00282C5973|nr:hypothetical protein [Candidatus Termiticorpusculum sp.]